MRLNNKFRPSQNGCGLIIDLALSDHVQKRVLFCLSFIGDSHGWREPRAGVVHAAFIPEGLFSRHSPIRNKRNDLGSETRLESIRSGGRYLGISELIINYAFLWV